MRRPIAHPADWRPAARGALLLVAALASAGGGLWLYAEERSDLRLGAHNRRAELQAQLTGALARNAALPLLRRHQGELAMRLAAAEEALWPQGADTAALLQAKLGRRAEECGLAMEALRPLAAPGHAVGGAEISVSGDYAQLLRFVELVTTAPWPVLVDAMDIVRIERGGAPALRMTATLRILPRTDNEKEDKT